MLIIVRSITRAMTVMTAWCSLTGLMENKTFISKLSHCAHTVKFSVFLRIHDPCEKNVFLLLFEQAMVRRRTPTWWRAL